MPFHLKRRYKISISHFNIHTALARFEREASSTTNLIQSSNFSLLQWNKNCIIRTRNTKLMAMLRMISSQNKQKYAQLLYYFFFCSTLLRLGGVETRWSPTTLHLLMNGSTRITANHTPVAQVHVQHFMNQTQKGRLREHRNKAFCLISG